MNIAVIGLGLIGGSFAKAIKENTDNLCFGFDKSEDVLLRAKKENAIDDILNNENIALCDFIILALYPKAAIEFLENYKHLINTNTIVFDCAGVKEFVCEKAFKIADEAGFTFVGGHPMAGIEKSGYENSFSSLFKGASMILTPNKNTDKSKLEKLEKFILSLGFSRITQVDVQKHDRIIAYTSQLAHVLSSAYIKSETANEHDGLSAGSFNDMTRVAKLNPEMWTELFLENRENLINEIETLIEHLNEFKVQLEDENEEELFSLLKDGSDRTKKIKGDI